MSCVGGEAVGEVNAIGLMTKADNTPPSLITLREFVQQWKVLVQQRNNLIRQFSSAESDASATTRTATATNEDTFDCRDLASPSVFEKVDKLLPSWVQAWRDLDRRKISGFAAASAEEDDDEDENCNDDSKKRSGDTSGDGNSSTKKAKKNPFWFDKHVRLPEQFDYTNQGEPPPELPETENEDRVVSLLDPTQPTSYRHELWHLFDSVPTSSQLMAMDLNSSDDSEKQHGEDCDTNNETKTPFRLTRAVHSHLIQEWVATSSKNANVTADYGLYPLRLRDRHDFVGPAAATATDLGENKSLQLDEEGTLTLELWRQPHSDTSPPTPDAARMVLEFRGHQTLWDVHRAIVELTGDSDFWKQVGANKKKNQSTHDNDNDSKQEDYHDESGFIFSEGTFYATGKVDYIQPIQTWLLSGDETKRQDRVRSLGLKYPSPFGNQQNLPVQSMADISLQDWPVRLGRRYVHVHHGNVECSLFVVDMQCMPVSSPQQPLTQTPTAVHYPILHDVWASPSKHLPECAGCQRRIATLVTCTTCEATNGHKALCQVCARELRLAPQKDVQSFSVWNKNT